MNIVGELSRKLALKNLFCLIILEGFDHFVIVLCYSPSVKHNKYLKKQLLSANELRISGVRSRPTNPFELSRAQTSVLFGD